MTRRKGLVARNSGSEHESRGDASAGRIKGIRGLDWERLITARCRLFFNEQLDPISRGQQQPSKSRPPHPPSAPCLCQCLLPPLQKPPYRHCLSVSTIPLTSLGPVVRSGNLWLEALRHPALIWQPQIMPRLQRGAAAHIQLLEGVLQRMLRKSLLLPLNLT